MIESSSGTKRQFAAKQLINISGQPHHSFSSFLLLIPQCRSYVKNNGINSYDASYIPRRTKEAVALSKKEGRAQKSDVPAKDSKGSEPMSYPDLVKSITASMKAQHQRKQTEQPI